MSIVRVWEGFSSTGGFIGAVLGAWIFYTFIRPVGALRHADIICFGFPFGWFFGRMGCAVVHDHIGSLTTWPIGMEFPDYHVAKGIRHELGLYEMVYMILVMAIFFYFGRRDRVPGPHHVPEDPPEVAGELLLGAARKRRTEVVAPPDPELPEEAAGAAEQKY